MEGQEACTMSNSEILAVAKILLESRAFSGREMTDVLQKMVDGCVPRQNMKVVSELISNEFISLCGIETWRMCGRKIVADWHGYQRA